MDFGKKTEADINEKLKELVYPSETHYIGYHTDPLLDEYFFAIAFSEVQLYEDYDTFH